MYATGCQGLYPLPAGIVRSSSVKFYLADRIKVFIGNAQTIPYLFLGYERGGVKVCHAFRGEGEKTRGGAQEQSAGERRHGRRKQKVVEEAEKPAEESEDKKGLVNDPAKEAPFLVKMTLSTYDFGSAAKKPAAGEDAAEGAPEEGGAEAAAESKEGEE